MVIVTYMQVQDHLAQANERARKVPGTLTQLRNLRGWSDTDLARMSGMSRPTVGNKLRGDTPITALELAIFATLFQVPIEVLYLGPKEAIRWMLDHPEDASEGGMPFTRWYDFGLAS